MSSTIHIVETIEQQDLIRLPHDRYENTEFRGCVFAELNHTDFTDCVFTACNLSNIKFNNCKLDNVEFRDCKLTGGSFAQSKDFGFEVHFVDCIMDYTSFDKKKMNKSSFQNCRLHEANFTEADLTKVKLLNCDFKGALFSKTNLTGVDFRSSNNFLIDPQDNFIKKAKFRSQDLAALLYRYELDIF